jgi:toxin ParE1/3/4
MKVIWTKEALEKLSEIEEFIAKNSQQRAEQFVNYLIERDESISQNPFIGHMLPEISKPNIRELIIRKYRIVYRIKEEKIEILTVFEVPSY